ncbi:MAG: class I SAM-dependent methyltransferase [Magnetospirillum sp.]
MTTPHSVAMIRRLAEQGRMAESVNAALAAIAAHPQSLEFNTQATYLAARATAVSSQSILQQMCVHHFVATPEQLLRKFETAFAAAPDRYELFITLSIALCRLEWTDLAIQAFANALNPARPQDVVANAIVREYDHSAQHYDQSPAHHASIKAFTTLLAECVEGPRRDLAVIDAACGSGLAAATLRPWSQRLTGMDLSPPMLAMADQTGLYDRLVEGDMVAAMAAAPDQADLVVCAGGTYYLRDLAPFLAAARTCLKPGGQLFFADFPALDGMGVMETIGGTFRYCRSAALTRALAVEHGFSELNCVLELSFNLPAFHWHFRRQ